MIVAEINAKATILPTGFTAEPVARGEAAMAVRQISELMVVPGVDIVGRLPAAIGSVTMFTGGVLASSPNATIAVALLQFLSAASAAPALASAGLDPPG